jgi:hypothetical protein
MEVLFDLNLKYVVISFNTLVMKTLLVLFFSFLCSTLFSQINLLHVNSWRDKVEAALSIVQIKEPAIFKEIVSKSTIQAGDLKEAGYAAFCDVQESPSGKILWIMIGLDELKKSSQLEIASIIVHESLHIQYRLHDLPARNWGNFTYKEKQYEHTQIFNYELTFLKKFKGSNDEIAGLKRLMRKEKIPIL